MILFAFPFYFLLVISLFQMAPKNSAAVLKSKKAVKYLIEKTCVLDKLCSIMSCNIVSHEFNVNESKIFIN